MMATMAEHGDAARLAKSAGELLLGLRTQVEAGKLPLDRLGAEGDRRSNSLIMRVLRENYPADAILSEEAVDDLVRLDAKRVWIVDPLDGTREYGELGRWDWAVHIALWERDLGLIAGAVALPVRNIVLSTGGGVPTSRPPLGARPRVTVSRSRPPAFTPALLEALDAEVVDIGSAGAKTAAIITGMADAYVHAGGQYEWDNAAPAAVAKEAGLHCSRLDGSPLLYNRRDPLLPDLVICRPELTDRILSALADVTG